jgi:hypothetical protein
VCADATSHPVVERPMLHWILAPTVPVTPCCRDQQGCAIAWVCMSGAAPETCPSRRRRRLQPSATRECTLPAASAPCNWLHVSCWPSAVWEMLLLCMQSASWKIDGTHANSLLTREAQPDGSICIARQHTPGVDDCAAVTLPSIVVACNRVASLKRALYKMCFT